jgi:hypothetical protein
MKLFKDVQKIIQDLLNLAQEKSTSPLAGTFAFFFLLYNWKPLFYFFESDDSPKIKISQLETLYAWDYELNLFTPLVLAIISLLGYTVISGLTILVWRVLEDGLDKLTLRVLKKATFLTHKQEEVLREDMENQAVEHSRVIDDYQQKLLTFQRINKNILLQNAEHKIEEVSGESNPSELPSFKDILYFKSSSEGRLKLNQYIGKEAILDIDDPHALTELKSLNYLILSAIKGAPNPVTMNETTIKVGLNNGNQINVNKALLITYANKLKSLGLFEIELVENGMKYMATRKLIEKVIQLLPN